MVLSPLQLLEAVRDQLDDHGGDTGTPSPGFYARWQEDDTGCLWKNTELVRYLNNVLRELGQRHPLKDGTNYPLTLSVGRRHYELEPEIVRIDSITRASDGQPLVKTTVAEMQTVTRWNRHQREALEANWRTETGWSTHYLLDEHRGLLTVYPMPDVDHQDTLRRVVWRTYLDPADWERPQAELEEVPEHYFEILVTGICARAYRKRDADTYAPKLAAECQAEFDRRVGVPMSLSNFEAEARWADMPGDLTPRTYFAR